MPRLRSIALLGPGLDGRLAIELVRRQGIEVVAATFATPFTAYHEAVVASAQALAVELIVLNAGEDYLERVRHPRFGYTRELAPCLDCKVLMMRAVRDRLAEHDAAFVVTGDVVGQRTPGQTKRGLALVDFHAEMEGRVLRPLSARLLPRLCVIDGVDYEALEAISGRGRQRQLALAHAWRWSEMPAVTSGCLLADAAYARRLDDLRQHGEDKGPVLELLNLGRYFRLGTDRWAVVGRNAVENTALRAWWQRHRQVDATILAPGNFVGPTALTVGTRTGESLAQVSALVLHYGRKLAEGMHTIVISDRLGSTAREAAPLPPDALPRAL